MRNFLLFFILILLNMFLFRNLSLAATPQLENYTVTESSIGFLKLGMSLNEVKEIATNIGYKVVENDRSYIIYDKNGIPIITFNVFLTTRKNPIVRSIKTTSNKYYLENGMKLVGNTVENYAAIYPEVSIFRVKPNVDSPEIVDFKGWPFSESKPIGGYIVKYTTELNKITDEYGNTSPVGIYPTKFALYTDKFIPEAKIESFQIESIEPQVKFNNGKF